MNTLLLLVIVVLLFTDFRDRRRWETQVEASLKRESTVERRIRRLTDQAVLDMLDEVRRAQRDTGFDNLP